MADRSFEPEEVADTWVRPEDRYVVALVVGIDGQDCDGPEQALQRALWMAREDDSHDVRWSIYDRRTGRLHLMRQLEGEIAADHASSSG